MHPKGPQRERVFFQVAPSLVWCQNAFTAILLEWGCYQTHVRYAVGTTMGFALLGTPTQESAGVAGNTPGIGVYFAGWARTTIVLQGTAALPAIAPSMGYAGLVRQRTRPHAVAKTAGLVAEQAFPCAGRLHWAHCPAPSRYSP